MHCIVVYILFMVLSLTQGNETYLMNMALPGTRSHFVKADEFGRTVAKKNHMLKRTWQHRYSDTFYGES